MRDAMDSNKYVEGMKNWAKVVSKAWSDDNFKKRLTSETNKVLQEEGIPIDSHVNYKIVENTKNEINFIIPIERKLTGTRRLNKPTSTSKPIKFKPL